MMPIRFAATGSVLNHLSINPSHSVRDIQRAVRYMHAKKAVIVTPTWHSLEDKVLDLCQEQGEAAIGIVILPAKPAEDSD